jgi:hypothetical protein
MAASTKTGARHSAADYTHINSVKAHARQIMDHATALGADDDMPDDMPMKAMPMGVDPVLFVANECGDIQMAAGALWTLATLVQSETFQDSEDASVLLLTSAARQLIAYITGELDDIDQAGVVEELPPDTEDMAMPYQPQGGTPPQGDMVIDGTNSYKDADTLIYAGDAVKSLPAGHVGGYLVRFSTPNDPDLSGEYFTKDTDFGIKSGDHTHVWFHHRGAFKTKDGRTLRIANPIGEGTLKMDDIGVFVDAVLYNRAGYEQVLDQLGWSSGTASHIVETEPTGKATWIKQWYLGLDATLTFAPCEPRNSAIPLKSITALDFPNLDTKSADAPETDTQTAIDHPVAVRSVLPALVSGYISLSESTIKSRLDRLRRQP